MAKKTAKKTVKSTKKLTKTVTPARKQTLMDKLPKTEVEHLELMLFYTERAIPNGYGKPDQGMVSQAERIKARIAELKKAV